MKSIDMRNNDLFMRNKFQSVGKYEIPLIRKVESFHSNINLISCADTKSHDSEINLRKGVHFFVDDYRFNGIYLNPYKSLERYSQYNFILSPDYSLYADMPLWIQLQNVAKNRWVGAFWQSKGLKVIPTVSWSTPRSYEFCFDGIERGSVVAVGMIGCKKNKGGFLRGYNEMLSRISPSQIIVFGNPFQEMEGNLLVVDYMKSRKDGDDNGR